MVALREKIKDLENQVAVSELVNEMKHGNLSMAKEYINLDKPFTEAISEFYIEKSVNLYLNMHEPRTHKR